MSWKKHAVISLALATVLTLGFGGGTARAGLDIDFGAAIRGDDSDLFVRISSRYFDESPDVVTQCEGRYGDPDDCGVALFLAARSHEPLDRIYDMRRAHLSWWQIGMRLNVPVDVWFVPDVNPAPPYGHAYGYWSRWQRNHNYRFTLSDRECRDLVAARMLHDYYGLSPRQAMQMRERGGDMRVLVAREYRQRHAPSSGRSYDRAYGRQTRDGTVGRDYTGHGHDSRGGRGDRGGRNEPGNQGNGRGGHGERGGR